MVKNAEREIMEENVTEENLFDDPCAAIAEMKEIVKKMNNLRTKQARGINPDTPEGEGSYLAYGDVRTIWVVFSVKNIYFAICTHGFNRIRPDIVTKRSRIVKTLMVLIGFFYYHKEIVKNREKCSKIFFKNLYI